MNVQKQLSKYEELAAAWRGGLIVSCQAQTGSPLARPDIIAALAATAERNGAIGVRIEGQLNLRAVKREVGLPVIGIEKLVYEDSDVYITPTYESAMRVIESGADVIALDATGRRRPGNETLQSIVARIRSELKHPPIMMADIATYEEGVRAAEEIGAEIVATTLSGYTAETADRGDGPDLELVERLTSRLQTPIICEGRLQTPDDVRCAFRRGAFAVVVGTAITGIDHLVRLFARATPAGSN